ncbi:MAG TPA: hypothetical protein VGK29_28120 [Paludibaculum sp.]
MRRLILSLVLVLAALPAGAASFQSIVERVESDLGVRKVRMPGVGMLVNSFVFVKRPGGASSLNLATFEGEMTRFQAAVQRAAGREWKPMVNVHSRRDKEDVVIYVHAVNDKFELLIASSEAGEATLVQLKLEGKKILDWLRDPVQMNGTVSSSIQ